MKHIILIVAFLLNISVFAQDAKNVTLIVSGSGKTQNEAQQNALRSAIEQAFGTFISSKTEILNDNLVKDEIVSVANGSIQKFEIISEVQIPNGDYATSLKATVSVTKLTSFVESKGVDAEFKGNIFAFNINQQKLNEKNELLALKEIIDITTQIIRKSYYGSIILNEPKFKIGDIYTLPYKVDVHANENINIAVNYFKDNLRKLSLSQVEVDDYLRLNKQLNEIILISPPAPIDGQFTFVTSQNHYCPLVRPSYNAANCKFESIFLRNPISDKYIEYFLVNTYKLIFDFTIKTNQDFILKTDNFLQTACKNSESKKSMSWGLIPFFSPNENLYNRSDLPIIVTVWSPHGCNGGSGSNECYNTSIKSLDQYIETRCRSNRKGVPITCILTHNYINNGLVYRLNASSDVELTNIGKLSNVSIEYPK